VNLHKQPASLRVSCFRYLGIHLAEYKQKQEGNGWFGKNSRFAWLTSTQLCPIIWLVGLFLMAVYVHKVSRDTLGSKWRLVASPSATH
jgi:tryptophan-rich sensory protein